LPSSEDKGTSQGEISVDRKRIEEAEQELERILGEETLPDENPPPRQKERLRRLARRVGASIRSTSEEDGKIGGRPALISEIIDNIRTALQTHSMIDACRISARSCWITLVATSISLLAMVAAWVAALAE